RPRPLKHTGVAPRRRWDEGPQRPLPVPPAAAILKTATGQTDEPRPTTSDLHLLSGCNTHGLYGWRGGVRADRAAARPVSAVLSASQWRVRIVRAAPLAGLRAEYHDFRQRNIRP